MANPDVTFERTADGEILIVPPAGYESDDRNAEVIAQLRVWAKQDGRGRGSAAKKKMQEWMRAGVDLGWLIQPDQHTVYIYRPGQAEPELCTASAGSRARGLWRASHSISPIPGKASNPLHAASF